MQNEMILFGIGTLSGLVLGMVFDLGRAFRSKIPHKNLWVAVEDFTYWIFTGLFLFYLFEKYNKGVLRFYIFLGAGIGVLFYWLFLQKPVSFCFSCVFQGISIAFSFIGKIYGGIRKLVKKLLILPLKNAIKKITIMLHHT